VYKLIGTSEIPADVQKVDDDAENEASDVNRSENGILNTGNPQGDLAK